MINPFYAFISYVEFDQLIDQIETQKKTVLFTIQSIKNQEQKNFDLVQTKKNRMSSLRLTFSHHELNEKSLQNRITSLLKKKDEIRSHKELSAIDHEVLALDTQKNNLEDTMFGLLEEHNQAEKDYLANLNEYTITKKKFADEISIHEQQIKELSEKQLLLAQERDTLEVHIPSEYKEKYEDLRKQMKNPIVPVINSCCSACSTTIAHADIIQIKKHILIPCKQCYRLLYIK